MKTSPYHDIDEQIVRENSERSEAEKHLNYICDDIGPRFVGTPGYIASAEYMADVFRGYGMDRVELEEFTLNVWRRDQSAFVKVLSPSERELPSYELPYSGFTSEEGVKGGVIDVGSGTKEEIEALGDQLKGNIALCTGLSSHRSEIYERCEERGAIAFLLGCPKEGSNFQTGSIKYNEAGKIPGFSISQESTLLLQRLIEKGAELELLVKSRSFCEKDVTWNVVAEIEGKENPDEWVLMGGHLDSHEISPGAFDNAAGAMLVTETARLLSFHKEKLKRSMRFILFSGEEVGLLGAYHHAKAHSNELKKARFMLNSDTPAAGFPKGLHFHAMPHGEQYIDKLSEEMGEPLTFKTFFHSHSDHYPFVLQGLPTAGMGGGSEGPKMDSWYHMEADTPEKVPFDSVNAGAAFAARFLFRASNEESWPFEHRTQGEVDRLVESLNH
jgi:carboxypeptidase Q